jgi:single-strand DNA-binding protein
MSKGFSFAQIGGVLGKDPESRSTPSGVKIVSFSVAVEKWAKDGAKTHWFNVKIIGEKADWAEQNLRKGKSVTVSGDLQIDSWDDKQTGVKRTSPVIIAFKVDFADSGSRSDGEKPARQSAAPAVRQQTAPPARSTTNDSADPFISDDDIPF